jgi:hypothetical protein
MRILSVSLVLLISVMVSACDFWPKELKLLAELISQEVSGETTVWLISGDVLVINVAGSPLYLAAQQDLAASATEIAEQAIGFTKAPLESIAITFHAGEVSDEREKMREFIFLVMDNQPVLQPDFDVEATGPLTADEVQAAIDRLGETLAEDQRECVVGEVKKRAHDAGDPETLDPGSLEFLTAESWDELDAFSKRLFLTVAISTKALFVCAQRGNG